MFLINKKIKINFFYIYTDCYLTNKNKYLIKFIIIEHNNPR